MKTVSMIVSLVLLGSFLSGCSSGSADKEKVYDIRGKVIWAKPDEKKVRLDHEEIPGFMKAMEMNFDVHDAKLLTGLNAGDAAQGKLKVKGSGYFISELSKR